MTVPGLVVFILGVLFILVGAGLMVYSSLSKRATAGGEAKSSVDQGILKDILDFALQVLKLIAGFIPANAVAQVGFVILIMGIVLVLLPFLIPGL